MARGSKTRLEKQLNSMTCNILFFHRGSKKDDGGGCDFWSISTETAALAVMITDRPQCDAAQPLSAGGATWSETTETVLSLASVYNSDNTGDLRPQKKSSDCSFAKKAWPQLYTIFHLGQCCVAHPSQLWKKAYRNSMCRMHETWRSNSAQNRWFGMRCQGTETQSGICLKIEPEKL